MKKAQESTGMAKSLTQWFWGWFYTPQQNLAVVEPKKSIATTHMRLLKDAGFAPNQMGLVNDLIDQLKNINVSPLTMLMMGMSMMQLANGQHAHDANLTFADVNGGHYRYSYASNYPELVNCANQFKGRAAGVIVTALDFVNSTVFYSGMLSNQMIAMLEYHTGSNATLAEMKKITDVVAPAVQQINDAADSARLRIGLPIAIVGFILVVVGVALAMRCICRHRRRQYVDFTSNIRDSDVSKQPDETTNISNDLL